MIVRAEAKVLSVFCGALLLVLVGGREASCTWVCDMTPNKWAVCGGGAVGNTPAASVADCNYICLVSPWQPIPGCTAFPDGAGGWLCSRCYANPGTYVVDQPGFYGGYCHDTVSPIGTLDGADCAHVVGWACDADAYSTPLAVHIYMDGPAGTGTFIGATTANILREPAVGTACGGNAYHGFDFTMPISILTGTAHTIYAYAIDNSGANGNPLLNLAPRTTPVCPVASAACPSGLMCNNVMVTGAINQQICRGDLAMWTCQVLGWVGGGPSCVCNAASFLGQTGVLTTMNVGQVYPVTVTFRNTGSVTWNNPLTCNGGADCAYRLASQNPQDNLTWGTGRVNLPASVAPGGNVTFSFNVTAPTTPGTYNFQWQMVEENMAWFGPLSTNVSVAVVGGNCTTTCASNSDCASGYCEMGVTPHKCWAHAGTSCNCNGTTICDGTTCSNPIACTGYCCASPGPSAVCCTGGYTCGVGNTCNIALPYPCTP